MVKALTAVRNAGVSLLASCIVVAGLPGTHTRCVRRQISPKFYLTLIIVGVTCQPLSVKEGINR